MSKITFNSDKTKAREGEYINVSWSCEGPDAVSLTIDNGYNSSSMQLADSGSRAILLTKSKGKTVLRLKAVFNRKAEVSEIAVKVEAPKPEKKAKAPKAKKPRKPIKNPFKTLKSSWTTFWSRMKYGWQMLPPRKRRTYKILFLVLFILWLLTFAADVNRSNQRKAAGDCGTTQLATGRRDSGKGYANAVIATSAI